MNGIRCPKCNLVNLLTAENCHRCGNSLKDLPKTAQVSVPPEETFEAQAFGSAFDSPISRDNETGRKTYFWYRVYCVVMIAVYICCVGLGALLVTLEPETSSSAQENLVMGIIYGVFGAIFAVVYIVVLFLPRKPYNWIVGIVMIAFGMTSCCFLPATIPLLIFWLKPETKAYFGRT